MLLQFGVYIPLWEFAEFPSNKQDRTGSNCIEPDETVNQIKPDRTSVNGLPDLNYCCPVFYSLETGNCVIWGPMDLNLEPPLATPLPCHSPT